MNGGKGEIKSSQRYTSGIVTRAGKPSHIPRPGKPKVDSERRDPTDIQRVLDRLDSIEDSLDTKINNVITSQEMAAGKLGERIKKNEEEVLVQSERVSALKDDNNGVKVQLRVHGAPLSDIEFKIERLEREKRRATLQIDGMREAEGEVLNTVVDRAFEELQVGFRSGDCTAIFRRGKWTVSDKKEGAKQTERRTRVRPIIVVLPSPIEKAAIFRNLKNLKDKDEWRGVFFGDDLTEQQANEQRDLRALAAYAKTREFNASVKVGTLWLDGRRYRYEELHRLPEGISLIKAKNLHFLDDKAIVFQSPHSPLSNLYPCNVTYKG